MRDWPARELAEQRRQWSVLSRLTACVASSELFDALLLVGSFAKGEADEASDVDLMIAAEVEVRYGELMRAVRAVKGGRR